MEMAIKSIEVSLTELQTLTNKPELFINVYFDTLENKIKSARESLLAGINQYYETVISKLIENKKTCLAKCSNVLNSFKLEKYISFLGSNKISSEEEGADQEAKRLSGELNEKVVHLKEVLLNFQDYTFLGSKKVDLDDICGELSIQKKVTFFSLNEQ
jgi:hypothetical protein